MTIPTGTITVPVLNSAANLTTLQNAIATAINNALPTTNLSTNAAGTASVSVQTPAGITFQSNPIIFNITFNGTAQTQINQPKINFGTIGITGAVGTDMTTTQQGTGREAQNITLGGTTGGLVSFQLGGQTRSYWDETQRITVPTGFPNGSPFFLTVMGTPIGTTTVNVGNPPTPRPAIIYDNSSPQGLQLAVQQALDTAFGGLITRSDGTTPGGHTFIATAVSATQVDIAAPTGANAQSQPVTVADVQDPNFVPPLNIGKISGNTNWNSPIRFTNVPLVSASFSVGEIQTITFPAQFVAGSTYNINFLGKVFGPFTFDDQNAGTQIQNIVNALGASGLWRRVLPR